MIDKFQKLFGPNPPRSTSAGTQQLGYGATGEDDVHRRQVSRLRNKRRFLGIMVLVVAAAVIAPSVFEPNDYYANRGAKLEIPALQSGAPAKVVSLAPEAQKPLPEAVVVPKAPSSAAALSAANTVNAGARPALEAPQPLEATGAQGTAAAQVVKNAAAQKVEKAAKAAAVAAAAENAKDAGAGKQSTSTSAKPQGQTNTASAKSEEPVAAPPRDRLGRWPTAPTSFRSSPRATAIPRKSRRKSSVPWGCPPTPRSCTGAARISGAYAWDISQANRKRAGRSTSSP